MSGEKKEESEKGAKPSWIKMKPAELEKVVVELAKRGESPAKIGLILRDKYGIPKARIFGKKITEILKEKGVEYETSKDVVDRDIEKLKGHISKNKHDYPAKRALTKKQWDLYKIDKKAK
ncbi:MAG: 30S ribosomal protein S15 [Nanoarchaeota archaeon]|nr:30S ribosomal protein S15 [Nanoarchaeota archaeon]